MLRRITWVLLSAICFMIPALFVGVFGVQAHEPLQEDSASEDCAECHTLTNASWMVSAHGTTMENPAFREAWEEAGNDEACLQCHTTNFDPATGEYTSENVTCVVCHNPVPGDHPNQIMPTDISSRMCGECHLDSYTDWEHSMHAQDELACVQCHDSHSTTLKKETATELCKTCHSDRVHFYSYTTHSDEGLMCTDCHLSVTEATMGEGHAKRRHDFSVTLNICADCHEEDVHAVTGFMDASEDTQQATFIPGITETLTTEPSPTNPFGFVLVAGLIGVVFGMVVSPWMERWYTHLSDEL